MCGLAKRVSCTRQMITILILEASLLFLKGASTNGGLNTSDDRVVGA
jgi:hypothetical protein